MIGQEFPCIAGRFCFRREGRDSIQKVFTAQIALENLPALYTTIS
jgi:hypothetical protein